MPPLLSVKVERDKKAKSIISFASSIAERLLHEPLEDSIASEIRDNIFIHPVTASGARLVEFETKGTELWNLSTRLHRSKLEDDKGTVCLLRIFAFNLLDSAHKATTRTGANCVRLLKVAHKTAKFCLGASELDYGVKVLERAASLLEELNNDKSQPTPDDRPVRDRLQAEYFVLRTTLAWKQSKLEVAEHMYQKATPLLASYDGTSAEELADVLYEIGKDLHVKKQYELAARWLERAYDVISEHEVSGDNAGELRLSIMQQLAKAFLSQRTDEALEKARTMVVLMDESFANKMVVSLLKLELFSAEKEPSPEDYGEVLRRMSCTIPLTRPNFKTIMHHLHKLRKLSCEAACRTLDDILTLRLIGEENAELIERACMMRIWMSVDGENFQNNVQGLSKALDNVFDHTRTPFSAAASHAAQTLLWKQIELAYTQKQYELAETYCQVTQNSLFEKSGEINRAKILRKLMLCSIAKQDLESAQKAYSRMSDAQQNSPQTSYLMYKIGLRRNDPDLATQSLDIVCRHSTKDATLLYACVLEAQQNGNKMQAVQALQRVLLRYDYNVPKGVHLPALLRSTVRLIKSELSTEKAPSTDTMDNLCKCFESAVQNAKKSKLRGSKESDQDFNQIEIDWFSRNSYNMALELCAQINPSHLIRLCTCCIEMIKLLLPQAEDKDADNLRLRHISCEFLALCAAVVLARSEDEIQASLQHNLTVRQHSTKLRDLIKKRLESKDVDEATRTDLIAKHFEAVKYEAEAILHLENWDDMDILFQEYWLYESPSPQRMQTMADLAFVMNEEISKTTSTATSTHRLKILSFIQRIINKSWKTTSDIQSHARWIRCLFQISLSTDDNKIPLFCIDQAMAIAQKKRNSSAPFPSLELEWLAATSFNRAVDFYCVNDDGNCRLWAEKALMLAELADDGGALRKLLQGKYSGLHWEST